LAAERIQYKLEGVLDDEHRKLLERHTKTIVEQVGIMNGMVRDFRDYAKLPKPKLLEMQLNEVLEEARHLYEHDDFAMALELDAGLKPLRADKAQILQVLHNLLSNAREAARPGTVCHVRITTKNVPQGVLLNITDDGTGFPQSIMDKAFEPYVTTKATGTGLGLPMVKKIADEHAAQLTLANDPDTGGGSVTILFTLLAPARANRAKTLEEKSS